MERLKFTFLIAALAVTFAVFSQHGCTFDEEFGTGSGGQASDQPIGCEDNAPCSPEGLTCKNGNERFVCVKGSVRSGSCSMQGRRLMHHAWCRVRRRMQAPALLWRRQRPSTGESGRRRRLPNVRIRWHDHHYLKHTSRWSWRRGWRRRPRAVVLRQVRRTRLLRLRSVRRHLRRRPHLRLRRMDRDRRSRFVRRRRFRRRRRNRRFRRSNHQLE